MSFLHTQIQTSGPQTIEVVISGAANVLLMDPLNYYSYSAGGQYNYYGGHFNHAGPCYVAVPSAGIWNLVVDSGPTFVSATYRLMPTQGYG